MTAADVRDEIAALLESLIGAGVVSVDKGELRFERPDAPRAVAVTLASGARVLVTLTTVRAATVRCCACGSAAVDPVVDADGWAWCRAHVGMVLP